MTIKREPGDFQVEELLAPELLAAVSPEPRGFALYRLEKTGLATPEAAAAIARRLNLPPGALAYAGLKDKHSRSVQHLTLKLGGPFPAAPESAEGPGWKLARLGWLERPLAAPAIAANRFHVTVRELTAEACADMDQAVELLGVPPGFVNYFGDQRFGSARHGRGFLAKNLVRGEFEAALKLALAIPARKDRRAQKEFKRAVAEGWGRWQDLRARLPRCPERRAIEHLAQAPQDFRGAFCALPYFFQQLCVYAYQSFLWNATARALVAERCAPLGAVLAADDPFGEMLFPAARSVPEELRELQLPLLGHKSELREPWKSAAEAVLAAEQLTTAQLRIPGLRRPFFGEEPRRLFVETRDFSVTPPEPEPGAGKKRFRRTLVFALPRGAYATVFLRALGQ